MQLWSIVAEVLVLLAAALALGMFFEQLRQSAILGYLLAGTLLGPHVLDWGVDQALVSSVSELGVSLLLFTIGLEFSLRRLRQIGPVAVAGGSMQVIVTTLVGGAVASVFGVPGKVALVIGAMVAMSSTACVLRVLVDRGEVESVHGRSSLGVLLMQDIAVVPIVLMVTMLAGSGSIADMAWGLARAAGLMAVLVVLFYGASTLVLHRLFQNYAILRNRELLVLLATVLALGSAAAAHKLGLSPALGAFAAGMLMAELPFAVQVRSDVAALRVLFVTLFFTSIGMMGDPAWIVTHAPLVALVVVLVVVGKAALVALITPLFGVKGRHAIAAGITLGQIGEFSFVIAGVAFAGGLFDEEVFRLFVSVTLVTLFLTPYLVTVALPLGTLLERGLPRSMRSAAVPAHEPGDKPRGHVVIIGYGTAGQLVAEQLARRNTPMVVVDISHHNIAIAKEHHLRGQLGDATSAEVLQHAAIEHAVAAVVTLPDHRAVQTVVHLIRTHAPGVPIIARARYHIWADEIRRVGPDVVIDEERQTGHRLGRAVQRYLRAQQLA